jgi:hypothetical protein
VCRENRDGLGRRDVEGDPVAPPTLREDHEDEERRDDGERDRQARWRPTVPQRPGEAARGGARI